MSTAINQPSFPVEINHKLQRVRRRQRVRACARGLFLCVSTLIALMLVSMCIDWGLHLKSVAVRVSLPLVSVLASMIVLASVIAKTFLQSMQLKQAAGNVESEIPQLEERWATVTSIAESGQSCSNSVTIAMMQQLTNEAVALGRLVNPSRIATSVHIAKSALLFAVCLIVFGLFMSLNWDENKVLFARFWAPTSNITATQIKNLNGDLVVPRGDKVYLEASLNGVPRHKATLYIKELGQSEHSVVIPLDRNNFDEIDYEIPVLEESFDYRFEAGDGATDWQSVTAIDRPEFSEVHFSVIAPEYVDREVYEKNYLPDHVRAIEGSQLKLEFMPSTKLRQFTLTFHDQDGADSKRKPDQVELRPGSDGWYRFETVLLNNQMFAANLVSLHELKNDNPTQCRIRVIPDRAPVAKILNQSEELAVTPDEVVEIEFEAHDDHGIAKAELVIYEESNDEDGVRKVLDVKEISLDEQLLSKHVKAKTELDLKQYDLPDGKSLSYSIRVQDNRDFAFKANHSESTAESSVESGPSKKSKDKDASQNPDETETLANQMDSNAPQGNAPVDDASDTGQQPETQSETADSKSNSDGTSDELVVAASSKNSEGMNNKEGTTNPSDNEAEKIEKSEIENGEAGDESGKSNPEMSGDTKVASADQSDNENEKANPANGSSNGEEIGTKTGESPKLDEEDSLENVANVNSGKRSDKESETRSMEGMGQNSGESDKSTVQRKLELGEGQGGESNLKRLKIVDRLVSVPETSDDAEEFAMKLRDQIVAIDHLLEQAEEKLQPLVEKTMTTGIADPEIEELKDVDSVLSNSEELIAQLRKRSEDTEYAFAGLQMVEIGATHITPSRDHLFALIQSPDRNSERNASEALHRVLRARELLAELLVRYDRVKQDRKLTESLDEAITMYEVYVENLNRFLRVQREPVVDPLTRKMAVVEVDQQYLDRYREVTEMRRDLMDEFGRLLGDDPRLRSKYMDVIKRRRNSLRESLKEINERQEIVSTELAGWLQIKDAQRDGIWMLAAEIRLQDTATFAKETSLLEERIVSQFPLGIDQTFGVPKEIVTRTKDLSRVARTLSLKARRLISNPFDESIDLSKDFEKLETNLFQLLSLMESLERDSIDPEVESYVENRQVELRDSLEKVLAWKRISDHLDERNFAGLVEVDQEKLAHSTELFRLQCDDIDNQLGAQFEDEIPSEIVRLVDQFKFVVEGVTFNQAAATFDLTSGKLEQARGQQRAAMLGLTKAIELFEEIRRITVKRLDEIDPDDPNIDDLNDPTLDQLLERLEREPDLNALLGLPRRPRNLRRISDWVSSQAQSGEGVMSDLTEVAKSSRKRMESQKTPEQRSGGKEEPELDETEREWKQVADAQEAQRRLQEKIDELKKQSANGELDEEQAEKLQQTVKQLEQFKQELANRQVNQKEWEEMVKSEKMQAVMKAMARGEPIPDTQWNRIRSALGSGLWQGQRKTPPEEYRSAIEQYQDQIRKLMQFREKELETQ